MQPTNETSAQVVVNGEVMDDGTSALYRIPAGRYWYDVSSGLWGAEGATPCFSLAAAAVVQAQTFARSSATA